MKDANKKSKAYFSEKDITNIIEIMTPIPRDIIR